MSFRGVQQPFTNVYYYVGATLDASGAATLADVVKANEVSLHGNDVAFTFARVWTSGGTPAENNMLHQQALTGTGNQVDNGNMDRERAVLVSWPAGHSITGQPVFLRKWYHSCGNCAGVEFTSTVLMNAGEISVANRTTIATAANLNRAINVGGNTYNLISKSGRQTTSSCTTHRFLEHHQLGDAWR